MKNAWLTYSTEEKKEVFSLGERYKDFLSTCKTERECVDFFIEEAKKEGYKDLNELIDQNDSLKEGDGLYANCMGKTIAFFKIGKRPVTDGMNIL